jgi:hypothetical protein
MDRILKIGLALGMLALAARPVMAYTIPTFPSCLSPQGTLKVSYPSGVHGIVGDSGVYTGEDKVYTLSDQSLLQCFCAQDGKGIETRWWRISSLDEEERNYLKRDGWVSIPDGSLWGLEKAEYFAKNLAYSCKGGSGGDSGSSSNSSSGQVQGTTTSTPGIGGQILGLATTGGKWQAYVLMVVGVLSLGIALSGGSNKKTED